ncbi:MAG: hypothetical protein OXF25_09960 [Cyanobacteria bacterium MAG CAR3_bin_5]|nr:hypothetical protein [Cyanobacteria bacterium MAG CAR3_bin_5]
MGRGCISRRRLPSLARHETGWLRNPSVWTSRRQRLATQPLQSGVALPLSHTMGAAPSVNMDALPNLLSSKGAMAPAATGYRLEATLAYDRLHHLQPAPGADATPPNNQSNPLAVALPSLILPSSLLF